MLWISVFILNSIGHELFSTLQDIFAPAIFAKIEEMLHEHFAAKHNLIVEGYKFHTMHQTQLQTSADFLRQLRKQVIKCDYGESLDEMLRDQLVMGVFRENIKRRLLSAHKLTLQ